MFGSGRVKELEIQLTSARERLDRAAQEKKSLEQQLSSAKNRIQALEKKLAESEGTALQEETKKTLVEFQGLKELYIRKNKEIEELRDRTEEELAVETANKRQALEDEILENREKNQTLVSETVRTFEHSYQYYLDQVQALMKALGQAASETGGTLFSGDEGKIQDRFGNSILKHLQNDSDGLKQGTGDLLLISAEEAEKAVTEAAESAEKPAAKAPAKPARKTAQAPKKTVTRTNAKAAASGAKGRPAAYESCVKRWKAQEISARAAAKECGVSHKTFLKWVSQDEGKA